MAMESVFAENVIASPMKMDNGIPAHSATFARLARQNAWNINHV